MGDEVWEVLENQQDRTKKVGNHCLAKYIVYTRHNILLIIMIQILYKVELEYVNRNEINRAVRGSIHDKTTRLATWYTVHIRYVSRFSRLEKCQ